MRQWRMVSAARSGAETRSPLLASGVLDLFIPPASSTSVAMLEFRTCLYTMIKERPYISVTYR